MAELIVATSIVKDGSMYNRHDLEDATVIENRERFLAAHDITMDQATFLEVDAANRDKVMHDTDWCRYVELDASNLGDGMRGKDGIRLDGMVTLDPNHALALAVADCIGTVIYDPKHHVLMMAHLGRQSLEQDGGIRSIEYLTQHHQSQPSELKIWMTPAAGKDVYPIWALGNRGMKEVALEQLAEAGIDPANITDNPVDTDKDPNYFSYTNFYNGRADVDGDHMIVAMMTN
jgi:copper oxidase (laccase) domain-containing protein